MGTAALGFAPGRASGGNAFCLLSGWRRNARLDAPCVFSHLQRPFRGLQSSRRDGKS